VKLFATIAALLLALGACRADSTTTADVPKTKPQSVTRGRTQMWTENCIRCHNARSPGYYSDREWQVAMHHMRVRCSITPKEYKAILGFLQSAN